jgi:hypothetical protein
MAAKTRVKLKKAVAVTANKPQIFVPGAKLVMGKQPTPFLFF